MDREQIIDAVRNHLDDNNLRYEYRAENHTLLMEFPLKSRIRSVRLAWSFLDTGYILYGISPVNSCTEGLDEVLKYAALINYGLVPGNIEVDISDGEIRSKTWVTLADAEKLSDETIHRSIGFTYALFSRFGNGFAALAMGFSDAETEYRKAMEPKPGDGE